MEIPVQEDNVHARFDSDERREPPPVGVALSVLWWVEGEPIDFRQA